MVTTAPWQRMFETILLFSVMAGPHGIDPLTLADPGTTFLDALEPLESSDLGRLRIGFSKDLGGLPIDPEVTEIPLPLRGDGAYGRDGGRKCPDLKDAMEVFQVQRPRPAPLAKDEHRPKLAGYIKETARWNIEKGLALLRTSDEC